MGANIGIIDYGMGNLRSVQKALEYVGCTASLVDCPQALRNYSHIVLPGVGAFEQAMERLRADGMDEAIREAAASGKPFLGICLGMQLLFESSDEGGDFQGLGLVPGHVRRLRVPYKVPHMGWNDLLDMKGPLFAGLPPQPFAYFVHSYAVEASPAVPWSAYVNYGVRIAAAIWQGNVLATQFHPEKSGGIGLRMLKNFGGLT